MFDGPVTTSSDVRWAERADEARRGGCREWSSGTLDARAADMTHASKVHPLSKPRKVNPAPRGDTPGDAKGLKASGTLARPTAPVKMKVKAGVQARSASRFVHRDATGHLDPAYAADLHARSLASAEDHTVDRAFLRNSNSLRAPLAEELGREAVMTMTTAEDQSDQLQDAMLDLGQENGGPFVLTTAGQEFARGSDRSNPRGATREPFPRT